MSKGKLIVIDGGDASGKTTQAKLLVQYLRKHKRPVLYFDFPQYKTFYGKIVAQFLRGEFGRIEEVSPYLASLAYSLDRASVRDYMNDQLSKGMVIVANRYATSNLAHQGSKFSDRQQREAYIGWDIELEYKVHKIPKEDIVIYLYVPWRIAAELTGKRPPRAYLNGVKDIHEHDTDHISHTEEIYLELSRRFRHWVMIDCVEGSRLLSPQEIHNKVITVLKRRKIIDK